MFVAETNLSLRSNSSLQDEVKNLVANLKSSIEEYNKTVKSIENVTISGVYEWESSLSAGSISPLLTEVMKESKRIDADSEACVSQFEDGSMSLNDCLKTFIDQRKRYHVVQAKQHLLTKRQVEVVQMN